MRHEVKPVYTFDELKKDARERARTWWREGALDHEWWDHVYDNWLDLMATNRNTNARTRATVHRQWPRPSPRATKQASYSKSLRPTPLTYSFVGSKKNTTGCSPMKAPPRTSRPTVMSLTKMGA